MKAPISLFLLLFIILTAQAQVGINTTTPDESSMLDITATNKGLLIPRVFLTGVSDVTTIPSPSISLLVYNANTVTDMPMGFYYWEGSKWQTLSSSVDGSNDAWSILGNSNIGSDNFLGTINTQPLFFRVNDGQVGKFHPTGGISLGYGAVANDNNSIALGRNSKAAAQNEATAIGPETNASGLSSLAIGYKASATNNQGAAIGFQASSQSVNGIAIGTDSKNSGISAVALGHDARAMGSKSLALGRSAITSADNATAIGTSANASNTNAVAIGSNSAAPGQSAVALGQYARAVGEQSLALGTNARVTSDNATAIGTNSTSTGTYSTAVGFNNTASGEQSAVFGSESVASGEFATAIGTGVVANQDNTIIIGNSTRPDFSGSRIGIGTNNPDPNVKLDVNDKFKLGEKGTVLKGISCFQAQITITPGVNIVEIDIPIDARPGASKATVFATIPDNTSDALSVIWVKIKEVATLRLKYNFEEPFSVGLQTDINITIIEF